MTTFEDFIKTGRHPILPFEDTFLRARLEKLGVRQNDLGRLLAETMDQSSETWHDNHAAEMIAADSVGLAAEAKGILSSLATTQVVEYGAITPKTPDTVTLGSLVEVRFSRRDQATMLITGLCTELDEELSAAHPDMEALSITSPLGAALLNVEGGAEVSYPVENRTITVQVGNIRTFEGPTGS